MIWSTIASRGNWRRNERENVRGQFAFADNEEDRLRKLPWILCLNLLTVALWIGVGRAAAPAARVIIAYSSLNERGAGALLVARDQGFFRKHDLDVQLIFMRNAAVALSALSAGEAQFYSGSANGSALGAMANGLDLVFVAGLANKLNGTMVAAPAIPYADPARAPQDLVDAIKARRKDGKLLNLDLMLLNSPAFAKGWNTMFGAIRGQLAVPAKLREISILAVGEDRVEVEVALQRLPAGQVRDGKRVPLLSAQGRREERGEGEERRSADRHRAAHRMTVVASAGSLAQKKGIELKTTIPQDLPPGRGDRSARRTARTQRGRERRGPRRG